MSTHRLSYQDLKHALEMRELWRKSLPAANTTITPENIAAIIDACVRFAIVLCDRAPLSEDTEYDHILSIANAALAAVFGDRFWDWAREVQHD